jgi:excisionase family DNA binding protein
MQKLLHSIDEGIEATGLKRTKFLEEIYTGRLKSVKVGRRRLITTQALEDYVESLVQQAADSEASSFTWPEQSDDR